MRPSIEAKQTRKLDGFQSCFQVPANAPWWPEGLAFPPAGQRYEFRFSRGERKIFKKKKHIRPSDWAEQNLTVTGDGPYAGSKFKREIVPFAASIMDALVFPSVREFSLCTAPQVTKSFILCALTGYFADCDPGPALFVYPDKITTGRRMGDLREMIEASPALATLMTGIDDDMTGIKIRLRTMKIYGGWAGSASSLGDRTIRYLFKDEKDKHPRHPNKNEAGTSDLADKRTNTYALNKLIGNTSTPTVESGAIWQDLQRADVIFRYHVCCPLCAHSHEMLFGENQDTPGGIKWPRNEDGGQPDPEQVKNKKLAWYECPKCRGRWNDHQRDQAVLRGSWMGPDGRGLFAYLETWRPVHIAFHIPSWLSRFISISDAAAAFIKGLTDATALKDFRNNHAAEPWLEYRAERKTDVIMALRDDRPAGVVPGGGRVAMLLAGCDVQDAGIYCMICAVGYGRIQDIWLVREVYVENFASLEKVLLEDSYQDADGVSYPVQFTVIDSRYRTAEVYDFCRQHFGRCQPSMGLQSKRDCYSYSNIDYWPGTNKAFPVAMKRIMVNTTYYKDSIAGKLAVERDAPGAFRPHAEITETYAAQLCSEAVNDDGVWVQIGNRANHYWDCFVQILVAADIKGLKFKAPPGPPRAPEPEPEKKSGWLRGGGFERPGWLRRG